MHARSHIHTHTECCSSVTLVLQIKSHHCILVLKKLMLGVLPRCIFQGVYEVGCVSLLNQTTFFYVEC